MWIPLFLLMKSEGRGLFLSYSGDLRIKVCVLRKIVDEYDKSAGKMLSLLNGKKKAGS